MASVLHPQTLMAFTLADDILPTGHGYPFKIRIAAKPNFGRPEFVMALQVTNQQPSGLWIDRGCNWFSGM